MSRDLFIQRKKKRRFVPAFFGAIVLAGLIAGGVYAYDFYLESTRSARRADAATVISDARALVDAGDIAGARAIAAPIADKGADPGAILLMADISIAETNWDAAETYLRTLTDNFPTNSGRTEALVKLGRVLEQQGRDDDARRIYVSVKESAPPAVRAPAVAGLARLAKKNGTLPEAQELAKQAVEEAEWDSPAWNEAVDILGDVNVTLIFSPTETSESSYYTVESGDNLTDIGKKLNTTQGLLTRANNMAEDATLRVGDRLKYTHKDFRIVIERETRRLFLYDSTGLFKRYHVGLGRDGHETTLGAYRIGNKIKNPVWHKPGAGPIPYGDPENELGTRWMPLVPEKEDLPRDLGIHGTWVDESVGLFSSSGCARLSNADVEELYDLVVRATPVDIVERQDI